MSRTKPKKTIEKETIALNVLADKRQMGRRGALYFLLCFSLLIFSVVVGIALYAHYQQEHSRFDYGNCNNLDSKLSAIDKKVEQIKVLSSEDEKGKLLLRAANKYHLVLFSHHIMEKIKANEPYEATLKDLNEFASGSFDTEINVLKDLRSDAEVKNSKIIEGLRGLVKVMPGYDGVVPPKTWVETLKSYFSNAFKFKKVEETAKTHKAFSSLINEAIEKIAIGDYEIALHLLESVNSKDTEFALKVLRAKINSYNAAKKIMYDNLVL